MPSCDGLAPNGGPRSAPDEVVASGEPSHGPVPASTSAHGRQRRRVECATLSTVEEQDRLLLPGPCPQSGVVLGDQRLRCASFDLLHGP